MILAITFVLCVIPIFTMGLFIKKGKWLMLLAGYNMMPTAEREKIDKKHLSKSAGNMLLRISVELTLLGIALYFNILWLGVASMIVLLADVFISTIAINRKITISLTARKFNKIGAIVFIVLTSLIFTGVGVIIYNGEKEPAINITDNRIQIDSMYGVNINLSDISDVSLIEKSMSDIGTGQRTNGYGGIGQTLKGYFHSSERGNYMLFVKSNSSPTILIEQHNGKNIYISFNNSEKTGILYNQLAEIIP